MLVGFALFGYVGVPPFSSCSFECELDLLRLEVRLGQEKPCPLFMGRGRGQVSDLLKESTKRSTLPMSFSTRRSLITEPALNLADNNGPSGLPLCCELTVLA